MRIVSTLALALALGSAGMAAPALAKEKAPATKYTPAVQGALGDAQKALKANDIPTAEAKIATAKAAVATDDDRFITGQIEYQVATAKKDDTMSGEAIDMMIASNKAPVEMQKQLLLAQGQRAYIAKNYPRAEQQLVAAQAAGATDDNLVPMIVSSMQFNGETLKALTTLNAAIDANVAAGRTTPNDWFQRGLAIGYGAKTSPADMPAIADATSALTRKWVVAYPTKSNWHDAMVTFSSQYKVPSDVQIDVFRLLRAAGALSGDADYREYAEDVYLRYPNEAKSVLEEGSSKGIVNLAGKNDASEVLGIVKAKVAADQASLAGADKNARLAANGKAALSTADAYVGYGQYPKAIDLYKVAIAKGGIDAPTAMLHMGWAMAMAGDIAGAKQQFSTVTGVRKQVADFWIAHLDHPTQG